MATTIQEYATEIGVRQLVHFTRESNLASILNNGLVTRGTLTLGGFEDFNDNVRADHTDAVCVSIGFPNYKMWYGIKQDNPKIDWVILVIKSSALWELDCAFCYANAALNEVAAIPIDQRRKLQAFQSMYADVAGKERVKLGIPAHWPTNPQAEVLMLRGVPKSYIRGVIALNKIQAQRLEATYPDLKVWISSLYFEGRKDYAFWKAGA